MSLRVSYNNLAPSLNVRGIKHNLDQVIKSGRFILGETGENFEDRFAAMIHAKFGTVVSCASGTDALKLAMLTIWERRRSAPNLLSRQCFITPPNSAPATHAALMSLGLVPIFCDVGANGLILPDALKVTLETAKEHEFDVHAVVPVHLWGQMCDMRGIHDVVKEVSPETPIIEDAAQSVRQNYQFGKYSDAVAFSFYPTKNLGCLGDGGAVAFQDPSYAMKAKAIRNYGLEDGFQSSIGMNSRLDEIQAGILLAQMEWLSYNQGRRDEIAALYDKLLRPEMRLVVRNRTNHHIYPAFFINGGKGREARRRLLEEYGIETGRHYPVPSHKHYALNAYYPNPEESLYPMAEQMCEAEISLPIWPGMSEEDVRYVAGSVNKLYEKQT